MEINLTMRVINKLEIVIKVVSGKTLSNRMMEINLMMEINQISLTMEINLMMEGTSKLAIPTKVASGISNQMVAKSLAIVLAV